MIRGKQTDDAQRVYLHRGIAARQFQRSFVLAEGIEVRGAWLDNGLLHIDLVRPPVEARVRTVPILVVPRRPALPGMPGRNARARSGRIKFDLSRSGSGQPLAAPGPQFCCSFAAETANGDRSGLVPSGRSSDEFGHRDRSG